MTMNPLAALAAATCDKILNDELVEDFILRIMAEASEIGARIGCTIEESGCHRIAVPRPLGAFQTSMSQDVAAGRATEPDALLGPPRDIGGLVNVAAPHSAPLLCRPTLLPQGRRLFSM